MKAEAERHRQLGEKIQTVRRHSGKTLQDSAETVGVSFQQFQRYEHGLNAISAVRLKALAEKYGVTLEEFFDPDKIPFFRPQSGTRILGQSVKLCRAFERIDNSDVQKAVYHLILAASGSQDKP
ncbi:helix-turn-helix domain-containing protein [Pelagibius sp. Alg239-R121]|uniref:helix-turn-helix domain-containing protein n=1 Tax=Pelagibius sp. Alg239-R121 TaxID=2993448 RepID=UPI0024A6A1A6|nr:helix-turn-helix transcriptional regulator [Pelagibius sp. Alg239-R121]